MPKLTKKLVESTPVKDKDVVLRDSELKGFLCKVTPKGKRIYLLYYRTKEGRERRPAIGVHGNITCDQARDIAKQWLAIVAQGGDPSKDRVQSRQALTIKELGEQYLEDRKHYIKTSSHKELTRLWKKVIVPELGGHKISQIDASDIMVFHKRNSHRPYAANRMLESIRSAFNFAIENKLVESQTNPCKRVKKYPEKKRERFLSSEEIVVLSKVLAQEEKMGAEQPNVVALIRLLLLTGCRLSEILTLKWAYIDSDSNSLRLPDSKTGAKTVYLSPAALSVIEGIRPLEGNPYVIWSDRIKGAHLAPPQKAWRRIRSQAGLDNVRLHDLRHSFASVAAASGLSLHMIGALLGHKQPQTTARYAHLIGDPVREATTLVGQKIFKSLKTKAR